jgi:hypothetical protein
MAGEYKRMPSECNSLMNVTVASPDLNMIKPKQGKNLVKKLEHSCTIPGDDIEWFWGTLKANSHIPCHSPATKGLECVFRI